VRTVRWPKGRCHGRPGDLPSWQERHQSCRRTRKPCAAFEKRCDGSFLPFWRAEPLPRQNCRVRSRCRFFLPRLRPFFCHCHGSRRRCLSINYRWHAPRCVGATRGHRDHSFPCVDARCVALTDFLTSLLDALRSCGASRVCPSPRGRLFSDFHFLCIQIGGHGGHDHDRRDRHRLHHCIVNDVVTVLVASCD
jgi:hypothetical protein